jgi:predicted transcriptional regulator
MIEIKTKPIPPQDVILSPIQERLLAILDHAENPISRSELVSLLHRPRTTIYDNLTDLITMGLIVKYSRPMNALGRPIVYFRKNGE